MRKCKIDKALDDLNAARGLAYPAIGFACYANLWGDPVRARRVYAICNVNGGVTNSPLQMRSARATLAAIRNATRAA